MSFTVQLSDMGILCFRVYDGQYIFKNFYLTLDELGDALGFTFEQKAPPTQGELGDRDKAELLAKGVTPKKR